MTRKYNPPLPGTPEWQKLITASKVPALVKDPETGEFAGWGHGSAVDVWNQMKHGDTQEIDEATEIMFRSGHVGEGAARAWLERTQPLWVLKNGGLTHHDPKLPFPNMVTLDIVATHYVTGETKFFEVKTPIVPKDGVPPGWWAQIQFQMHVSGIHSASLLVVEPRRQHGQEWITEHHIDYAPEFCADLVGWCSEFYETLAADECPFFDPSHDVAKQWRAPECSGETVEVDSDLAQAYADAVAVVAEAEKSLGAVKARILAALGDGRRVEHDGRVIVSRKAGRFSEKNLPAGTDLSNYMKLTPDTTKLRKEAPDLYEQGRGKDSLTFETKAWL